MEQKKRQVFYSFHYENDNWRASTVRSIGAIEGNRPAPDNDWETVKHGGDAAIEKWIDSQMLYRSCAVVLIGSQTAGRKWINYEIKKAWNDGKGIVGIKIHRLLDSSQKQAYEGLNPFDNFTVNNSAMSSIVKTYNPPYSDSKDVYAYIRDNIGAWTNEAVAIRERY